MKFGLAIVVYIIADTATAVFTELPEHIFKVFQAVGLGSEVAEVVIAFFRLFLHDTLHIDAVVAVKSIAFDRCGFNTLTFKNAIEGLFDRGCSSP